MMDRSDGGAVDTRQTVRNSAWAGAFLVSVFFLGMCALSWGKWADIFVDFGNELYLAWRLTEGDQLYRDIAYRHGPLPHYVNAIWFHVFGVSIRTLALANLLLFAGISALVFRLVHRARGVVAATVAGMVLVGIFGFGQYVSIANYNYVTPYQHAQTHALLLTLVMISALGGASQGRVVARFVTSGVCLGLVFLTKIELFVPAAVTAAVGLGVLLRAGRATTRHLAGFVAAVIAPFVLAFAALSSAMPAGTALIGALGNWSQLGDGGAVLADAFYVAGAGLDDVVANTLRMIVAALGVAAFAGACVTLDRLVSARRAAVAAAAAFVAFTALASGVLFDWGGVARGLPVLCAFAATSWCLACLRRGGDRPALERELPLALFAVYGVVLLAKILLAARIEQYGFVLAMPATLALCVALVADLPARFSAGGGEISRAMAIGAIAAALFFFVSVSSSFYARKTLAVGTGADTVMAWPRRAGPLATALEALHAQLPSSASLLVMPEGVSLNYWLRRVNPTPYTLFLPAELAAFGGEQRMLEAIRRAPPDFVVLVNRPGDEFGLGPFGSDPRFGRELLRYVEGAYRRIAKFGAEPFREVLPGVVVMQRERLEPGTP